MSCEGLKPVCAIYSTFLQRGFDQLVHDVCIQNLNVKFCLDRGGIAGGDGPTHHGLLESAYLRSVPNIIVMAPKDEGEMRDMMLTMLEHNGPAAIRYPRGNGVGADIERDPQLIEIGKGEILRDGGEIAIVAYGSMVHPSLKRLITSQRMVLNPPLSIRASSNHSMRLCCSLAEPNVCW